MVFLLKVWFVTETYKDDKNNWINPEETTIFKGERVLKNNSIKLNVEC